MNDINQLVKLAILRLIKNIQSDLEYVEISLKRYNKKVDQYNLLTTLDDNFRRVFGDKLITERKQFYRKLSAQVRSKEQFGGFFDRTLDSKITQIYERCVNKMSHNVVNREMSKLCALDDERLIDRYSQTGGQFPMNLLTNFMRLRKIQKRVKEDQKDLQIADRVIEEELKKVVDDIENLLEENKDRIYNPRLLENLESISDIKGKINVLSQIEPVIEGQKEHISRKPVRPRKNTDVEIEKAALQRKKEEELRKRQLKKEEELRRQEQARQAEEARKEEEARRQREAEEEAEARRQREAEEEAEARRQREAEAEARRKVEEAEQQRRQAAEEAAKRQKQEAARRQAEEARRQAEEARRQAEEARRQREAEEEAQRKEEARRATAEAEARRQREAKEQAAREEKARQAAEAEAERLRKEEAARRQAAKRQKQEAARRATAEAEARRQREAEAQAAREEKARRQREAKAEQQRRKLEEEKARKRQEEERRKVEAEEEARRIAEAEKRQREAEEEAEQQRRKLEEERLRKEEEERLRKKEEEEERLRKEEEARRQREAEAEARRQREAEARRQREAKEQAAREEKARQAAEAEAERLRKEEAARRQAAKRQKQEAARRATAEAEARRQREAQAAREEKARRQREAKAEQQRRKLEEEKARKRQEEERRKVEAEEEARRIAEAEKRQREAEEEAEQQRRKLEEERLRKEEEERLRKKEERLRKEEEEEERLRKEEEAQQSAKKKMEQLILEFNDVKHYITIMKILYKKWRAISDLYYMIDIKDSKMYDEFNEQYKLQENIIEIKDHELLKRYERRKKLDVNIFGKYYMALDNEGGGNCYYLALIDSNAIFEINDEFKSIFTTTYTKYANTGKKLEKKLEIVFGEMFTEYKNSYSMEYKMPEINTLFSEFINFDAMTLNFSQQYSVEQRRDICYFLRLLAWNYMIAHPQTIQSVEEYNLQIAPKLDMKYTTENKNNRTYHLLRPTEKYTLTTTTYVYEQTMSALETLFNMHTFIVAKQNDGYMIMCRSPFSTADQFKTSEKGFVPMIYDANVKHYKVFGTYDVHRKKYFKDGHSFSKDMHGLFTQFVKECIRAPTQKLLPASVPTSVSTVDKRNIFTNHKKKIGNYIFVLGKYTFTKDNRNHINLKSIFTDQTGTKKETIFACYRSRSEGGFWRSCIPRFNIPDRGWYEKGANYITSSFIHLDLQIFINSNYDKLTEVGENLISAYCNANKELFHFLYDENRFAKDDVLAPLKDCKAGECFKSYGICDFVKKLGDKNLKSSYEIDLHSLLSSKLTELTCNQPPHMQLNANLNEHIGIFYEGLSEYLSKYFKIENYHRFIGSFSDGFYDYKVTNTLYELHITNLESNKKYILYLNNYNYFNKPEQFNGIYKHITNIVPIESKITKFGLYSEIMDVGTYIYKPIEYLVQCQLNNRTRVINTGGFGGCYVFIGDFQTNVWPLNYINIQNNEITVVSKSNTSHKLGLESKQDSIYNQIHAKKMVRQPQIKRHKIAVVFDFDKTITVSHFYAAFNKKEIIPENLKIDDYHEFMGENKDKNNGIERTLMIKNFLEKNKNRADFIIASHGISEYVYKFLRALNINKYFRYIYGTLGGSYIYNKDIIIRGEDGTKITNNDPLFNNLNEAVNVITRRINIKKKSIIGTKILFFNYIHKPILMPMSPSITLDHVYDHIIYLDDSDGDVQLYKQIYQMNTPQSYDIEQVYNFIKIGELGLEQTDLNKVENKLMELQEQIGGSRNKQYYLQHYHKYKKRYLTLKYKL